MPGKKPKIVTMTTEEIKKLTDEYIIPSIKAVVDRNEDRLRNIKILLGIDEKQSYYLLTTEQRIDLFRERIKEFLK